MSDVNRRYFESLLADKKMSLRGLAQRMGLGHSQLSLTFSGARKMQLDEAAQLAQIFGEPLHRIVENAGVTVKQNGAKRIAVVGALQGDGTVAMHQVGVIERTIAPEDLPDNVASVQARTSGTPLDWMDGWVFIFREHNGIDPSFLGRFCLVKVKNGPAAMAAVRRGYQDNTYNLSGPFASQSVSLDWATPILMTRN
jgi:transcriptional regulator with XRE-family HTH domain